MKFRVPFTFSSLERLKRKSKPFSKLVKPKSNSNLESYLKNSDIQLTREEYISIVIRNAFFAFIFLSLIFTTVIFFIGLSLFYLYGPMAGLLFAMFIFFSQIVYPRIFVTRRQRNIDKNLIPALEDMFIQLNAGVPLFSIMVNISSADYEELSIEFKRAVRRIHTGEPEDEVLDDLGKKNPSPFFRRTLWQISNGMRSGSDMSIVIEDSIKALSEEQLIQIQSYGNKLNPLVMFYMLVSVIIPALSVTFLTVISSMVNLPKNTTILLFVGLFVFVVLVQIMFLGMIKSRRPRLL